jgi:hypothetical protein
VDTQASGALSPEVYVNGKEGEDTIRERVGASRHEASEEPDCAQ